MPLHYPLDTYMSYLDMAAEESGLELIDSPDTIIKQAFGEVNLNSPLAPVVLLSDFATKGFVFAHKGCQSVIGHSSKYLTDGGLDALFGNFHEDDFKIMNEEIFRKNFLVLQDISPGEMYNYIFSHTYRVKNKDGGYYTILQRFSYLLSPDNKPLGAVGHITDISMCNNGNQMVHMIEHVSNEPALKSKEIIYKHYFFHDLENAMISKRETEILKWISDGLISKQIADKLNISVNTVNNHRKKMLQKTNCKNTAELLRFAIENRLL